MKEEVWSREVDTLLEVAWRGFVVDMDFSAVDSATVSSGCENALGKIAHGKVTLHCILQ